MGENMKAKHLGLVGLGMVVGVAASFQLSAHAQKTGSSLPLDELRQLADVYGLIKTDYVEPVEDKKLLTEAIGGMVASLDPHSVYLDQKAFRDMSEAMQGKFVGVGVEIANEDGTIKVVSPIEESPAFKAGIKAGDLITRIDNVPVRNMSSDEAIKRMRGKIGSKVTLTLARPGEDKPWVVPLARQEIKVQSVKAKMIEPGYAWLRISQFQENTLDDLAKKTRELYAADPALKGLVLDLRNDPGGLLPGAIGVSAAFLPKPDQVIVSTKGQLKDSNQEYFGRREYYSQRGDPLASLPAALKTVPMVVLVNGGSASASEIVAGALQDYQRAIVMGSRTFGKGSVQTLRHLSENTAIKLTTARYYTPKGRPIQATGIEPDLRVDESLDGDLLNALRVRESDLQRHLQAEGEESGTPAGTPGKDASESLAQQQRALALLKDRKPLEFGGKDDFQLAQAINHFKGATVVLAKGVPDEDKPAPAPLPGAEHKPAELHSSPKK